VNSPTTNRPERRAPVPSWRARRSFRPLLVALAAIAASVASCSSGGGGKAQDYVQLDFAFADFPEGCPPAQGDQNGIGAPCTMGGNQCKNNQVCTCDPILGYLGPPGTPCYCTPLTFATCDQVASDFCGASATCCSYMSDGSLCVPTVCLEGATCPMFGP
jgi:hypothetical protein